VTRPGGGAIVLGVLVLTASWLAGSVSLSVVAFGLLLAGLWVRTWARRAPRGLTVEHEVPAGRVVEGADVEVSVTVRRASRLPVGKTTVSHGASALGEQPLALDRWHTRLMLRGVPRGCHALGPVELELTEPLGLGRLTVTRPTGATLVVDPRIEELDDLFTDVGARNEGGRRARMRRPGGFELHAVREYRPGEPLRSVHWPTTARRATLMVKELDDVPRDDVVVVLDRAADAVAGAPGRSSLDAAVRAAGSILRAYAARGRRAALQLTGEAGTVVRVHALERDWIAMLDALAAVAADESGSLVATLGDPRLPAVRAPELVVVTAAAATVAAVLEARVSERRPTAIVAVDAPSFAGRQRPVADPTLLRLAAVGVRVATLRNGDDLAAAVGGALGSRAHA
jgi:uncharacterized protein (DUF58 family)